MNGTTEIALDAATALALTMLLVGVLKAFVEKVIPPTSTIHDSSLQLLALVIGIGWSFAFMAAAGPFTPNLALSAVITIVTGVLGSGAGVGVYHVATAANGATAAAIAAKNPAIPMPEPAPTPVMESKPARATIITPVDKSAPPADNSGGSGAVA
jgi:hypothetical protein